VERSKEFIAVLQSCPCVLKFYEAASFLLIPHDIFLAMEMWITKATEHGLKAE
jgi:hypothetical protein